MLIGEAFAVVNAVFWALTGIFIKRAGPGVSTTQVVLVQSWFAAIVVALLAVAVGRFDDAFRMPLWVAGLLAGGAVINAGGQFIFFSALKRGNVGVVYTTTTGLFVVFSLASSAIFLNDTVSPLALLGAPAIIGGLYIMNVIGSRNVDGTSSTSRRETLVALGLGALTAAIWTIGLLTTARAVRETDIWSAAMVRNTLPALMYLPLIYFIPRLGPWRFEFKVNVNLSASSVFYVASFMTFMYSISRISPGLTALLSSTSPVFALALATLVLRERLTRVAVVGASLSILGMVIVLLPA